MKQLIILLMVILGVILLLWNFMVPPKRYYMKANKGQLALTVMGNTGPRTIKTKRIMVEKKPLAGLRVFYENKWRPILNINNETGTSQN